MVGVSYLRPLGRLFVLELELDLLLLPDGRGEGVLTRDDDLDGLEDLEGFDTLDGLLDGLDDLEGCETRAGLLDGLLDRLLVE